MMDEEAAQCSGHPWHDEAIWFHHLRPAATKHIALHSVGIAPQVKRRDMFTSHSARAIFFCFIYVWRSFYLLIT